ncbi:MAG TPA: alpha/beta fold hydrolase, partial [Vicinamibacterales bacterium]|nr:alpha/beta fold hydrolase [Vicinamibacterales bacterium]
MMTILLHFVLAITLTVLAVQRPVTAREQAPPAGRTVRVNDMEMYYEERGAGEPLVLLHRFGGCTRIWLPLIDRLAEHFRLIVPDLRGHGRSTNPAGTFTLRQWATDIFAL